MMVKICVDHFSKAGLVGVKLQKAPQNDRAPTKNDNMVCDKRLPRLRVSGQDSSRKEATSVLGVLPNYEQSQAPLPTELPAIASLAPYPTTSNRKPHSLPNYQQSRARR